jgi:hypothetical protein
MSATNGEIPISWTDVSPGAREVLGPEDHLLDLFLGREGDRVLDQLLRSIDEVGGLAVGIFQDLAAGRVRGVTGDPGPAEGARFARRHVHHGAG